MDFSFVMAVGDYQKNELVENATVEKSCDKFCCCFFPIVIYNVYSVYKNTGRLEKDILI